MTTFSVLCQVRALDESSETEKTKSAGSALTEKTDVAVRPTGPLPASAVMMAPPAAWLRNTRLNASGLSPRTAVFVDMFPLWSLVRLTHWGAKGACVQFVASHYFELRNIRRSRARPRRIVTMSS